MSSSIPATELAVSSRVVERVDGDVRPAVAGVFTAAPTSAGLTFSAVGDTRFQTSPTGWRIALGVVAVLAFLVALGALVAARRRGVSSAAMLTLDVTKAPTTTRRLADLGVVGGLLLWQVIGPLTVDDGYIAGIVRSLGQNGQVGTVFRWLNSPETPFGWFYDVLAVIAAVDPAPFWLRLPATALGIVGWFLLTRGVLPASPCRRSRCWPGSSTWPGGCPTTSASAPSPGCSWGRPWCRPRRTGGGAARYPARRRPARRRDHARGDADRPHGVRPADRAVSSLVRLPDRTTVSSGSPPSA